MKLTKTVLFAGALSSFVLFSCADESPWGTNASGEGSIKLYLSPSSDVSSALPKVRSVSTDIVAPEISDFKIRLSEINGNYTKVWNSVSDFEKEESFPSGSYTLEAYYGSPTSQGVVKEGERGHEHSYFYGTTETFHVDPGKSTSVQLEASLANSIVVIEYTNAFKNYFKDWNAELITRGEETVALGNQEGICYVIPGDVDVVISATLQNGKTTRVNPAVFEAEAQHLYKIRYNIYNGEIGQADKLEVTFNDDPIEDHKIIIDLTDDLFSEKEPTVLIENYEGDTMELENLYGYEYEGQVRFIIDSPSGIAEAWLTIKSDTYTPDFLSGNSVNLLGANDALQSALTSAGIKSVGLFGNVDKMAFVDISQLLTNLPDGNHQISISVIDKAKRTSAPAMVKITTFPVEVEIENLTPNIDFGTDEISLILRYNGIEDPTESGKNPFTFNIQNGAGNFDEVTPRSIEYLPDTRGFEKKAYKVTLPLPASKRDEYKIQVYRKSQLLDQEADVKVIYPEYTVDYDAYARRLLIKVSPGDETKKKLILENLRVFAEDMEVTSDRMTYDESTGIMTVKDMTPGKVYSEVKTTLKVNPTTAADYTGIRNNVQMEEASTVPNGDFSQTSTTINIASIPTGGKYGTLSATNQNTSGIMADEAIGWASINAKTCNEKVKNKNTWFEVPSTFVTSEGNINVCNIRSVGYDFNGTTPTSTAPAKWYCTSAASLSMRSAGEMFLGNYVFNYDEASTNFTEDKQRGVAFSSRPSKFKYSYSYVPKDSEIGYIEVKFYSGQNVAYQYTNDLNAAASLTEVPVEIPQFSFGQKVDKIEINFRSTKDESNIGLTIPSGDDLKDSNSITANHKVNTNEYAALATGSLLKVANLIFEYE